MGKATLVIMAAGIGSRFGGGIKQLEPMGPNGEIIMDYSIHDAIEAGFDKVVFVIRKDLEKDFKEVIGNKVSKIVDVAYAYQELDKIPEKYSGTFAERKKPWGTGQAIVVCKNIVNEPFLVINADDYYGKDAYVTAYKTLVENNQKSEISMVGFVLGNTLSENGGVTRGICKVDDKGMLSEIVETKNIMKVNNGAAVETEDGMLEIDVNSAVSMNMWGLTPEFIDLLEERFSTFLEALDSTDLTKEYLLPTIIGDLLSENKINVRVLSSHDKWFGVTFKEDKELVIDAIRDLISKGLYSDKIYK